MRLIFSKATGAGLIEYSVPLLLVGVVISLVLTGWYALAIGLVCLVAAAIGYVTLVHPLVSRALDRLPSLPYGLILFGIVMLLAVVTAIGNLASVR